METFGMIFMGYVFGAIGIHYFCVLFLSRIPLIDQYCMGIRNILCFLWLVIVVIMGLSGAFSGSNK